MRKEQKYKNVFQLSEGFLRENLPNGIKEKELQIYLKNNKKFSSLNDIFERMALSLQNYQAMPNIIKFEKRIKEMKVILFDFNVDKILRNYNEVSLYAEFCNKFPVANKEKKNNSWLKYTRGIISGAKYLSKFNDHLEFDKYAKSFFSNKEMLLELPNKIKDEIYGLGFALSCDFLKELGYTSYPKPDVHLMDVFVSLGLSERNPLDNYKKIIEMSEVVNRTPYEVDKVFWLICSGKYYEHNMLGKPLKKELISYLSENM